MTDLPDDVLGENAVLSNRDKAQHGDERGLDGKTVQVEQYQDHDANPSDADVGTDPMAGNASGTSSPTSDTSRDAGSLGGTPRT